MASLNPVSHDGRKIAPVVTGIELLRPPLCVFFVAHWLLYLRPRVTGGARKVTGAEINLFGETGSGNPEEGKGDRDPRSACERVDRTRVSCA